MKFNQDYSISKIKRPPASVGVKTSPVPGACKEPIVP